MIFANRFAPTSRFLFDPISMGLMGAATSAIGTVAGGISSANSANYQAQIANNNAITAAQNAAYASAAGGTQAEQQSLKGAARNAGIKASLAANGVDANSGSAVDVEASAREQSKMDTLTTENNAQLQNYGYRTQEAGYQAQSELDKSQADSAIPGALIGATGGLLGNASSIGLKSPGAFNFFGNGS